MLNKNQTRPFLRILTNHSSFGAYSRAANYSKSAIKSLDQSLSLCKSTTWTIPSWILGQSLYEFSMNHGLPLFFHLNRLFTNPFINDYLLVTKHTYGNHHLWEGKSTIHGPFSIATLVYQRVHPLHIPFNHCKFPLNHFKLPLNHSKIPVNHSKFPVNHYHSH